MFLYLLLIVVNITFSRQCTAKRTVLSTQAPKVTNVIPVKDLGTYLVDLDQKILKMVILPERGMGQHVLDCMETFWKNFRHLEGLVVLSEQAAFRPAKYVVENECPKFVSEAFDVLNLQQTFNWSVKQFSAFRDYLLLISGLGAKFPEDFSRMRVDVETLFERPLEQQI